MKAVEKIFRKTKSIPLSIPLIILIGVGILLYGVSVWLAWNGVVLAWNWIASASLSTVSYWKALGFGLGIPVMFYLAVLFIGVLFEE